MFDAKDNIAVVESSILPYSPRKNLVWRIISNEVMNLKKLTEYLKLTEKTAYHLHAGCKLPSLKVGGLGVKISEPRLSNTRNTKRK